MNSEQGFFKVICSSEKMKIPPAFVLQMQGALANRVVLRDRHEKSWPVEVAREGNDCSFEKGWPRFYRENSLETGDILVFEYKGENLFDFILFGNNACEKGEASQTTRVKEEIEESSDEEEEENNEELIVESGEEDDDDDDDVDDDETDDEDYMKEEEEDEEEEEEELENFTQTKSKSKSKSKGISFGVGTIPSKRTYKKKNIPDCYGAEIFESGLAARPKNPYFVTRSRTQARKNELYIPKDVIVDYHLIIPKKLFLIDEQGRKWETNIIQWKDGRLWCTRGWRSLCNVNNIENDDTCICEFVKEDGCMHILVRVVYE